MISCIIGSPNSWGSARTFLTKGNSAKGERRIQGLRERALRRLHQHHLR